MKGNFKKPSSIKHQAKMKADKEYYDFKQNQKQRAFAISTMVLIIVVISAVLFAMYQSI
jgi:hypothetical protein